MTTAMSRSWPSTAVRRCRVFAFPAGRCPAHSAHRERRRPQYLLERPPPTSPRYRTHFDAHDPKRPSPAADSGRHLIEKQAFNSRINPILQSVSA